MGLKQILENTRKKAVQREIKKLIEACEKGENIFDALVVEPLSDLDARERDGWVRPDGTYYDDYIINFESNELTMLITDDNGTASYDTTIIHQIEIDDEYRDEWQVPSGNLYDN